MRKECEHTMGCKKSWSGATGWLLATAGLCCGCHHARPIGGDGGSDGDVELDGTAGDGDVDGDVEGDAPEGGCPVDMVEVPGTGFCIDRYECAIDDDGRAVSARGLMPAQSEEAIWPIAQDACVAAGKTLCSTAVWQAACSAGGTRTYPYGEELDPDACNIAEGNELQLTGSAEGCEGGLPGLFDMIGNASEWTADCERNHCFVCGGDADRDPSDVTCETCRATIYVETIENLGFRCCAPVGSR